MTLIQIIHGQDIHDHKDAMEQVWHLRHEVFVVEKNWQALNKPDKREIDQFDDDHAVHMLFWDDEEVVGYQRMLPTTRPYLLTDVYPHLCEAELPQSPNVWEWTRFAVKTEHRTRGRMLSPIANQLLSAIVEWGLASNVSSIIIEMNPLWLLRLAQLHFRTVPLGLLQKIDGEDVLAVQAHFDQRTLDQLCSVAQRTSSVLTPDQLRLSAQQKAI